MALIPAFTLQVPVSGCKDLMGNDLANVILHTLVAVEDNHPDLGTKLYAGKDGVFYPDDLDAKVKGYIAPPATPSADEPEPKKKKPTKKKTPKSRKKDS